jgi:protein-L-isoaspartate(D-aspartate) O-methyltransferase
MNTEQARFNMIEQQIRPWEVLDNHVLQLLSIVKREDFCPTAHKALAFVDMEIPLGDLDKGQAMLAPRVEARLLQDLAVQKHEKVLEVGTGSGFMAALLAHRAAQVISLEIDESLARQARANLQKAGIVNCDVRRTDGSVSTSWKDGPFDVILLSGSVAEIPPALLQQLKVGGRLAAIVGDEPVMRATFVTRTGDAAFRTSQPWDTLAPRLANFAVPSRFSF